jgi:hypothetical protein
MSDSQNGAAAAGAKRKFDSSARPASATSNGASSSHSTSHKKNDGGAWKKQRTDRDAGKPWAKAGPSKGAGGPQPLPRGGNGKPWAKAADWKANTPVALSRKDRDQMRKERKAQKPNADIIAEANKVSHSHSAVGHLTEESLPVVTDQTRASVLCFRSGKSRSSS